MDPALVRTRPLVARGRYEFIEVIQIVVAVSAQMVLLPLSDSGNIYENVPL